MSQAAAFESPWFVAGLRRIAESMSSAADNLDRAFQPAPAKAALPPETDYRLVLARAAEESLATTRDRISRYY